MVIFRKNIEQMHYNWNMKMTQSLFISYLEKSIETKKGKVAAVKIGYNVTYIVLNQGWVNSILFSDFHGLIMLYELKPKTIESVINNTKLPAVINIAILLAQSFLFNSLLISDCTGK